MRFVIAAALVAAVALLVFYPLMTPPILGLADNGDFGRISLWWALESPPADEYRYAPRLFERVDAHRWTSGFWSSEYVLARAAMALDDLAFERGERFDIRALGIVHGLFFLAAFAVLFPLCLRLSAARAAIAIGAMVLVLCDFSATSYLNTFYMDAPALVCALLAAVLLLRASITPGWAVATSLICVLAVLLTAKPQHAVLALPISILILWKGHNWWPRRGRLLSAASVAALAALASLCFSNHMGGYQAVASFNMAFLKFLPASKNVDADLRQLHLDEFHRRWIGSHAYSEGNPLSDATFTDELERRLPASRVAWFLATHPRITWDILVEHAGYAGRQRQKNLGNFERVTGRDMQQSHHFTLWSDCKKWLFEERGRLYLLWFCGVGLTLSWLLHRRRALLPQGIPEAGWTLFATAGLALGVGALGDALEVDRHLFLFNWLTDLMLVSVIGLLAVTAGQLDSSPPGSPRNPVRPPGSRRR